MKNELQNQELLVSYLEKCPFFLGFKKEELFWLAEQSELTEEKESSSLFKAGGEALHFFIICKGIVAVTKMDTGGHSEELARFDDGDTLGEFDFSRSALYDATATCITDCQVLTFPAKNKSMRDIANSRPDLATKIAHRAVTMISSRIRSTQETIANNSPWVRELRKTMFTDSGTGLWTRAYVEEEISKLIGEKGFLIFIKPDKFKVLCDTWGHDAGDVAMKKIAEILNIEAQKFEKAWAVRIRSNETGIIVSNINIEQAKQAAINIRKAYNKIDFTEICNAKDFKLDTFSSIAEWPQKTDTFKETVEKCHSQLMDMWNKNGEKICIL